MAGVFGREDARVAWALRLEKGCRPCEDIGFLVRRAAGGEEKLRCEG